jgi:hypothetical protein
MLSKVKGMKKGDVEKVRDRSFLEAYEVHDVGQELLERRLEAHGFDVEQHGDDKRHADDVYYGEGPDLKVLDDGETVAYVEVKTKEAVEWFGRLNLRHFREYVNFANEVSVPVFIWFSLVDEETSTVHREGFIEVEDTDQIDGDVVDVGGTEIVFHSEDARELDDEDDVYVIQGGDIVGVRNDQTVVDYIPSVHGNEVVELNDDDFRSFPYFLHRIDETRPRGPRVSNETVDLDDSSTNQIRALGTIAERAQQLLWERMQPNPKYDIMQLRTAKGRMGPRIDEDTNIQLTLSTDGDVVAIVDGDHVELGCVID